MRKNPLFLQGVTGNPDHPFPKRFKTLIEEHEPIKELFNDIRRHMKGALGTWEHSDKQALTWISKQASDRALSGYIEEHNCTKATLLRRYNALQNFLKQPGHLGFTSFMQTQFSVSISSIAEGEKVPHLRTLQYICLKYGFSREEITETTKFYKDYLKQLGVKTALKSAAGNPEETPDDDEKKSPSALKSKTLHMLMNNLFEQHPAWIYMGQLRVENRDTPDPQVKKDIENAVRNKLLRSTAQFCDKITDSTLMASYAKQLFLNNLSQKSLPKGYFQQSDKTIQENFKKALKEVLEAFGYKDTDPEYKKAMSLLEKELKANFKAMEEARKKAEEDEKKAAEGAAGEEVKPTNHAGTVADSKAKRPKTRLG